MGQARRLAPKLLKPDYFDGGGGGVMTVFEKAVQAVWSSLCDVRASPTRQAGGIATSFASPIGFHWPAVGSSLVLEK
jgi:hypothetical protein